VEAFGGMLAQTLAAEEEKEGSNGDLVSDHGGMLA